MYNIFIQVSEPRPPLKPGELSQKVSPTEQLSRGHAVLMRLLIAMENVLAKAATTPGTSLAPVHKAASLINEVIVKHHMPFEESYVYPKVGNVKELAKLADTLKMQHGEARDAIARIMDMTKTGRVANAVQLAALTALCKETDYLFKAHIAWEESVLFVSLYDLMDPDYFADLQDKILGEEKALFGSRGMMKLYDDLADVEMEAGTNRPEMFDLRRA